MHAADLAAPWDAPHFSVDSKAVYSAASEPAPPDGTDIATLIEEQTYVFDAQGRVVRTFYLVDRVVTQRGADGWDDVSVQWEPWHEDRPSLRARVITPDLRVHPLDAKTISDAPVKVSDSDLYGDSRKTRAPLPALAPGSVVEQEIVVKESALLFAAGVTSSFYLGPVAAPVRHSRLILDAPASLPLRYVTRLLPEMKPRGLFLCVWPDRRAVR